MALQDYQDLVLAIPFIVGAVWLCRRGALGFLTMGLAAAMCREELVPMIVLIGFTHPGSIRARIRWGMKAAAPQTRTVCSGIWDVTSRGMTTP